MENIEKVEKLRERANVTYEEARQALEENNWDLLDAMVSLERQGKTKRPEQENYSTSYEHQDNIVDVQKKVEDEKKKDSRQTKSFRDMIRRAIRITLDNSFIIDRREQEVFRVPVIALVIVILAWQAALPIMLIALLFGFRYRIEGKDHLDKVNEFMENAGNAAESLKEGFTESFTDKKDSEQDNEKEE